MSSGVRFEMVQKLQELRDKLQVLRMSDDGSRSRSQVSQSSAAPPPRRCACLAMWLVLVCGDAPT
eukprot:31136-Rhodomonas_salina.1